MESLTAKGDEFLDLTRKLESVSDRGNPLNLRSEDYRELLKNYDAAAALFEFKFAGKLKSAAAYLRDETIRLSMTVSKHPHFAQFSSNQDMARKSFEKEIAELVGKN